MIEKENIIEKTTTNGLVQGFKRKKWKKRLIGFDKKFSWVLVFTTALTILTGFFTTYTDSDPPVFMVHRVLEIIFILLLIFHLMVVTFFIKYKWKVSTRKIVQRDFKSTLFLMKFIQRTTGVLVLFSTALVIVSGLSYTFNLGELGSLIQHVECDNLLIVSFIIHVAAGGYVASRRRKWNQKIGNALIIVVVIISFAVAGLLEMDILKDTDPQNRVEIEGIAYNIPNTLEIDTLRPDIFQPGQFSLFDVLVYLDNTSQIDLEFSFNSSMNTYVIDSLNGKTNWWYAAYYDGGSSDMPRDEKNRFRMDHYPWKGGALVRMFQENPDRLADIYSYFQEEVQRTTSNGGQIIIPEVIIQGPSETLYFTDVEVLAHNLRNDTFIGGTIVAIDVIMTLGDLELIEYELKWYDSIGSAEIVRSYWVESINNNTAYGRCGFVYESGEKGYEGFSGGNHIHLPSDWRVLNSPDYVKYFWVCI